MLKANHRVYRVVEEDPPQGPAPHTWKVAFVVVESASDRQIKLKTYFPNLFRKVFKPEALGRVFFESPRQALQFFLLQQRREIESLSRLTKTVERLIAWTISQEGVTP